MDFAVTEFRQLLESDFRVVVREGTDGERHEGFVHMQARVLVAQLLGL